MPRTKKVEQPPIEKDSGIASIKETVENIQKVLTSAQPPSQPEKPKKKRVLSEDQKQALRERLVKAREAKQKKKESQ